MNEGLLPFKMDEAAMDLPAEALAQRLQEERRLMYVGITRARNTLAVSWLKRRKKGRETVPGQPSRFIKEMALDEAHRARGPARKTARAARRVCPARHRSSGRQSGRDTMKLHRMLAAHCLWFACAVCLPATAQTPAASTTPAAACSSPAEFSTSALRPVAAGAVGRERLTGAPHVHRHAALRAPPRVPGQRARTVAAQCAQTPGSGAVQALVSGDAIDGAFNLDESADGVAMDAVWEGAPADCGREIRGLRRPAEGQPNAGPAMNFLLKKAPGWG